jgi:hypothetical protein
MAVFSVTYPPKYMDAVATANRYKATLDDNVTPNPESRNDFVFRILKRYLKHYGIQCEIKIAQETANTSAVDVT